MRYLHIKQSDQTLVVAWYNKKEKEDMNTWTEDIYICIYKEKTLFDVVKNKRQSVTQINK